MQEVSDKTYQTFGAAVAGIMDAQVLSGMADAEVVGYIKEAANTLGIEFR